LIHFFKRYTMLVMSTAFVLMFVLSVGNIKLATGGMKHSQGIPSRGKPQIDDWWHQNQFGGEGFASNPFYNAFQQWRRQMDAFSPAIHVGKINRGQYANPDLYTPRDRAFGFNSDFNPDDSGAFKFAPNQQKVRATDGMIRAGLAEKLGEIISLPINVQVDDDGSVLVQTSSRAKHPCNPDPCKRYALNKVCTIENRSTAKCSSVSSVTVTVEWGVTDNDEDLDLYMAPAFSNGTRCDTEDMDDYDYLYYDMSACGGIVSEDVSFDYDTGIRVKEYTVLTTTEDGINFRDLTYAVGVYGDDIDLENTVFRVKVGDKLVQSILAPGGEGSAMDLDSYLDFYFVGCFRPNLGFIDTRGAGYFDDEEVEIFGGSDFEDPDLCYKLLSHPGPSGFNVNTFEIE